MVPLASKPQLKIWIRYLAEDEGLNRLRKKEPSKSTLSFFPDMWRKRRFIKS